MKMSLSALAKQVNVEVADIVFHCRVNGLESAAWMELNRNGRSRWRGSVSAGLAETVRQWHREGRFPPRRSAAEYDADIVGRAANEADRTNSFCLGFGAELNAINNSLQREEVDVTTARGQKLFWEAWKCFRLHSEYEPWAECRQCEQMYKPVINRPFVFDYVQFLGIRRSREKQAFGKKLFRCRVCATKAKRRVAFNSADKTR